MKTRRRGFLKSMLTGGIVGATGLRLPMSLAGGYRDYTGKLLVSVQANGGWDVTCFCDPKTNTPDEPVINHWAETDETRWAGNIPFAPFADNEGFFNRHHARMLVINGIDMQTNSHVSGTVHAWTGRSAEAFPTLSVVHAAHNAPDAALACLSFGAFTRGASLLGVADFGTEAIATRVFSNLASPSIGGYLHSDDWANMRRYHGQNTARLRDGQDLVPAATRTQAEFEAAFAGGGGLVDFGTTLSGFEAPDAWDVAFSALKSGVSVSADLVYGFFDTHSRNDSLQARQLAGLTRRIDRLWQLAEEHGLADRLVVVVGSEFGRTNYYNASDGKDHWPINSFVVMAESQPWTDRVVAATDDLHFARPIDPRTLEPDPNGTIVYPNQVHKALRRHLGLEDSLGSRSYPFQGIPDVAFFKP